MHVYRWDLDRTYLDTEIHSIRGLIRTALETASRKRNVPGSAALMRALTDFDDGARVCILSGSPTQMRPVLEEKLALDGVRYDKLILKDNLGNLKRGRLKAVRGQVGYKLPRLLQERVGLGAAVTETLFGDDSEADAAIYAVYADVVAGHLGERELARVLEAGNAYPDAVTRAVKASHRLGHGKSIEDIFIRVDKGVPLKTFDLLAGRVTPVFSWLQAAILLRARRRLDSVGLTEVAKACTTNGKSRARVVAGLMQDLVRRHLIDGDVLLAICQESDALTTSLGQISAAVSAMKSVPQKPQTLAEPDYIGFLRAVHSH
jgi:hypothetical protein